MLAIRSYLSGPLPQASYDGLDPLHDVLLADGRRGGLLFACIGVAALGAFGAWFYLRRIGAPAKLRPVWTGFCFVTGPLGLVLVVILERPRAYRRLPSVAAPSPRLFTSRSA